MIVRVICYEEVIEIIYNNDKWVTQIWSNGANRVYFEQYKPHLPIDYSMLDSLATYVK